RQAVGGLTGSALKALGEGRLSRCWPRDDAERAQLRSKIPEAELSHGFGVDELVQGESALFCATGISDSSLLPGVRLTGQKAITHSILMRARSRTIRYIRAVHDLGHKTIHLRSLHGDRRL